MHCRAYLLLEREYSRIQKKTEWGIEVTRSESNIFCWYATISGLVGSIWENGRFHITIRFHENYDDEPPDIKFNTIPFHPNIEPLTGEPCINLYSGSTVEGNLSINNLLVNLQALLSYPILDEAVNTEAANLLRTAPHIYMQLVKNCITESAKLSEVLKGQDLEKASKENEKIQYLCPKKTVSSADSYTKRPKQVSFDEYHKHWIRLASSQSAATISLVQPYTTENGVVFFKEADGQMLQRNNPLYNRATSTSPTAVSKTVAMDTEQKMKKIRQKKVERITAMKQLYLNNRPIDKGQRGSTAPVSSRADVSEGEQAELWEKEADELVAWTTTLEEDSV